MNINLDNSNFGYNASLKLDHIPPCAIHKEFPGVADFAVTSRTFSNYFDCSNSAREFVANVVDSFNKELDESNVLTTTIEVNPQYSGVDTKSKDWSNGELARFWIHELSQAENTTIVAVGQVRVFMLSREPTSIH